MLAALSGFEHCIARFFKFCDLDQQQLQMALGSWLAFQKIDNQAMVMGDLVAEEVSPVMGIDTLTIGRREI